MSGIRFFGLNQQQWQQDALREVCRDPRLGDILRWLDDSGLKVALASLNGRPVVFAQKELGGGGSVYSGTTWYGAAARVLLHVTASKEWAP